VYALSTTKAKQLCTLRSAYANSCITRISQTSSGPVQLGHHQRRRYKMSSGSTKRSQYNCIYNINWGEKNTIEA